MGVREADIKGSKNKPGTLKSGGVGSKNKPPMSEELPHSEIISGPAVPSGSTKQAENV